MIINSLNSINKAIKQNILFSLISLLTLSLIILNFLYFNNLKEIKKQQQYEIASNFELLKAYLSEKISIIANSNIFVDYLRSGEVSRKALKSDFVFEIQRLKIKEISGMEILTTRGETVYTDGIKSTTYINLPLCYFDRGLDSTFGACTHNLILYLNQENIVKSLKKINNNLQICKHCFPIDFLSSKTFGSFNILNSSKMQLSFKIKDNSMSILTINVIIIIFMVILASCTSRRTSYILNKFLNNPLKKITNRLKDGMELLKDDQINELAYLISQIQDRENRLKTAKDNEKLARIGEIASQVAHDIRSPIATINIIATQMQNIPSEELIMIQDALRQINGIANSLLSQYKKNHEMPMSEEQSTNILSVVLDSIIDEKKKQFNHLPVTFNFNVEENSKDVTMNILLTNFKRVISNILNNAVESILDTGNIMINLSTSVNFAKICVTDTGKGMPQEFLNKIFSGEAFSDKKEGTGIGLISSIKVIKSWGGNFDINSKLGMGTSVSITIPVAGSS